MEGIKSICWCCLLVGALVVVFAWWQVSWAPVALTILGVLVLISGFTHECSCKKIFKGKGDAGTGCCG